MVKGTDLVGFLDNDNTGFYLVAAETNAYRDLRETFTRTFISNHLDPVKYLIHVLAFDDSFGDAFWKSVQSCATDINDDNTMRSIIVYDYFNHPFESLEKFYKDFQQNYSQDLKNIVVIDKLNLLNCHCSHSSPLLSKFYKTLKKIAFQVFGIINATVSTSKELNEECQNADMIAFILDLFNENDYIAHILKNKSDSKPNLNKLKFRVVNGSIEQIVDDKISKSFAKTEDNLAALTTFKLTLNENERESKNKLHLPYFDAQRKSIESANEEVSSEEEFEGEEDEEI